MLRSYFMLIAAALAAAAPSSQPVSAYRLYFPTLQLAADEQVQEFTVAVACGHIDALTAIPTDWNVEVGRAVSATETLHASAGHGASYVRQLHRFDGMVHLQPTDRHCFSVSASIVAVFDRQRTIRLSSRQLHLRAESSGPPNER